MTQQGDRKYLSHTRPQFIGESVVYYTTGKFFIGFDLENEREAFRTESEGRDTTFALGKPVVLRGKKVLIDELEISTYEDAD